MGFSGDILRNVDHIPKRHAFDRLLTMKKEKCELTEQEKEDIENAWEYLVNRADKDEKLAKILNENFKELFVT